MLLLLSWRVGKIIGSKCICITIFLKFSWFTIINTVIFRDYINRMKLSLILQVNPSGENWY